MCTPVEGRQAGPVVAVQLFMLRGARFVSPRDGNRNGKKGALHLRDQGRREELNHFRPMFFEDLLDLARGKAAVGYEADAERRLSPESEDKCTSTYE